MNIDWWAVGILLYEMLIGSYPFFHRCKNELLTKIQHSKIVFPCRNKYEIDYSDDFVDLISKLLWKDKSERLGARRDAEEILEHPWFTEIDKESLLAKQITPPFIPK